MHFMLALADIMALIVFLVCVIRHWGSSSWRVFVCVSTVNEDRRERSSRIKSIAVEDEERVSVCACLCVSLCVYLRSGTRSFLLFLFLLAHFFYVFVLKHTRTNTQLVRETSAAW
jgi:hypothetical protein